MITSALFDEGDFSELERNIDKERLREDPEYRQHVLSSMSARQSKRRYDRKMKYMLYMLVTSGVFSVGILIGGYLPTMVARTVVTVIIGLVIVPLMVYMTIVARERKKQKSQVDSP